MFLCSQFLVLCVSLAIAFMWFLGPNLTWWAKVWLFLPGKGVSDIFLCCEALWKYCLYFRSSHPLLIPLNHLVLLRLPMISWWLDPMAHFQFLSLSQLFNTVDSFDLKKFFFIRIYLSPNWWHMLRARSQILLFWLFDVFSSLVSRTPISIHIFVEFLRYKGE